MRRQWLAVALCLLSGSAQAGLRAHGGSGSASGAGGGSAFTPSFNQPFAANSPWNASPINPVLGGTMIPSGTPFGTNNSFISATYSSTFWNPLVSDPPNTASCNITDELITRTVTIPHFPAAAIPEPSPEHHMDIYDFTGSGINYAFYVLAGSGPNSWTCNQFQTYDLFGSGWPTPSRPAGPRAAGISEGAGILRTWEENLPIVNHAMIFGISQLPMVNGPPQYPATNTDSPMGGYTGNQFHLGALLMLPPSFNVNVLATPQAQTIARTLQKYGGYITDTSDVGTGGGFLFYAEYDLATLWGNACNSQSGNCLDLNTIRNSLREVVSQDGWADANGAAFTPQPWQTMNFLSMRGPWNLTGGNYGFFNTISANYETPDTTTTPGTTFTNQSGKYFRDYGASLSWQNWFTGGNSFWFNPIPGKSYTIRAIGSGPGITAAFQIFSGNYASAVYTSASLAPGQSTTFSWPVDPVNGTGATRLFVTKTPAAAAQIRLEITPNFTQDYYVCGTGSDSNDGLSTSTAWKTLAHVNAQSYILGDTVHLCGGGTFTDPLIVTSSGYLSSPLTFTTYGTGRATIAPSAANTSGITILNQQYVTINNINVVGQSQTTDLADGVVVENSQSGNTKLEGILLENMDVSLFGFNGVDVYGSNGSSGFNKLTMHNVVAHDNTGGPEDHTAGITVSGSNYGGGISAPANINIVIDGCTAYNNTGAAGRSFWTGSGIVIGECSSCIIERSLAHDNGINGFGSYGIWMFDGTLDTLWNNVAYNQKTTGLDGGGFDVDGGMTNSFVQYNYAVNNQGPCILAYAYNDGSVTTWDTNHISGNICQNNGSRNNRGEIDLEADATMTNAFVYNNTMYNSGVSTCLFAVRNSMTGYILNNILSGASTDIICSTVNASLGFNYNSYYNAGAAVAFSWNGTNYSSFAAWQTATGQELYSSANVGKTANPVLVSPGGGTTSGPGTAYQLRTTSPMIGTGKNISDFAFGNFAIFLYSPWDYYGNAMLQTPWSVGSYSGAGVP